MSEEGPPLKRRKCKSVGGGFFDRSGDTSQGASSSGQERHLQDSTSRASSSGHCPEDDAPCDASNNSRILAVGSRAVNRNDSSAHHAVSN